MEIEDLTDELRTLVGWGARPHRLPHLATLRALTDIPEGASFRRTGQLMREQIRAAVDNLNHPTYDFEAGTCPREVLNRVLRLLFIFEGTGLCVTDRRHRVMQLLGLSWPMDQWRRYNSPERQLIRLLASEMYMGG